MITDVQNGVTFYKSDDGFVYSVEPCDWELDKHAWGKMLPTQEPSTVLILGVCANTVGKLIKQKYPNVIFTLVDTNPLDEGTIQADAYDYVMGTDQSFDYVVVDTYNGPVMPPSLAQPEFVQKLAQISKEVCVDLNTSNQSIINQYVPYFSITSTTGIEDNIIYLIKPR